MSLQPTRSIFLSLLLLSSQLHTPGSRASLLPVRLPEQWLLFLAILSVNILPSHLHTAQGSPSSVKRDLTPATALHAIPPVYVFRYAWRYAPSIPVMLSEGSNTEDYAK